MSLLAHGVLRVRIAWLLSGCISLLVSCHALTVNITSLKNPVYKLFFFFLHMQGMIKVIFVYNNCKYFCAPQSTSKSLGLEVDLDCCHLSGLALPMCQTMYSHPDIHLAYIGRLPWSWWSLVMYSQQHHGQNLFIIKSLAGIPVKLDENYHALTLQAPVPRTLVMTE